MNKIWIESWGSYGYAVHVRKKRKIRSTSGGTHDFTVWWTIGWVDKSKNGTWNAYGKNKHARKGKKLKGNFKLRKDAVSFLVKRNRR